MESAVPSGKLSTFHGVALFPYLYIYIYTYYIYIYILYIYTYYIYIYIYIYQPTGGNLLLLLVVAKNVSWWVAFCFLVKPEDLSFFRWPDPHFPRRHTYLAPLSAPWLVVKYSFFCWSNPNLSKHSTIPILSPSYMESSNFKSLQHEFPSSYMESSNLHMNSPQVIWSPKFHHQIFPMTSGNPWVSPWDPGERAPGGWLDQCGAPGWLCHSSAHPRGDGEPTHSWRRWIWEDDGIAMVKPWPIEIDGLSNLIAWWIPFHGKLFFAICLHDLSNLNVGFIGRFYDQRVKF